MKAIKSPFLNLLKKPKRVGWVVFVLFLLVFQLSAFQFFLAEREKEMKAVENEAVHFKNQLESVLNNSITASEMLSFLESRNDLQANFDSICVELLNRNQFIDALQLVEKSTIIKTYPLEGNEEAIGYNLLSNGGHQNALKKSIERNDLYFDGPFELQQGGRAIVGRLPIFKNNEFWGFAAVIIHIETISKAMHMKKGGQFGAYTVQLIKNEEQDKESNRFFPEVKNYDEGVYAILPIEMGNWNLYVKKNQTNYMGRVIPFAIIGFLFAIIFALFAWYMAVQPIKLRELILRKTYDLKKINEELANQTRALKISNSELEQFAYVASHDLQEPLRAITSFLTQLEKKYATELDDQARMYIQFSVNGAKQMRQVILDLLQFSQANVGTKIEDVSLEEVAQEVFHFHSLDVRQKRAHLVCDNLPIVSSHRTMIWQLFNNLIGNSLKFNREGVPSEITITSEDAGDEWVISVKDNGIGINEEYFSKVFDLFQRLNTNEYEGTGIGLAITKKILNNLGGRIWITSNRDVGCTFHFTIPKKT